jgi:hypothetical protein
MPTAPWKPAACAVAASSSFRAFQMTSSAFRCTLRAFNADSVAGSPARTTLSGPSARAALSTSARAEPNAGRFTGYEASNSPRF